jgi:predicted nucleotidyltransferase
VAELYGERIERVLLYGSRARGDASADSDYDIAVFLEDLSDRWTEADKIAVATTDILQETGDLIHAMPYPAAPIGTARRSCTRSGARGLTCEGRTGT